LPVVVKMRRKGADRIVIAVRDKGQGIPKDFDYKKSKGLGMRIISAFLSQLDAEMTVKNRKPGAEFTIDIPLVAPEKGS